MDPVADLNTDVLSVTDWDIAVCRVTRKKDETGIESRTRTIKNKFVHNKLTN